MRNSLSMRDLSPSVTLFRVYSSPCKPFPGVTPLCVYPSPCLSSSMYNSSSFITPLCLYSFLLWSPCQGALYLFDCLNCLMLPNPLGPVSLALLWSDLCFPESAYLALMLPRDWRLHWSLLRLDFRFAEIMSDTLGFCSANTKLCVQSPCQILALGLIKRFNALGCTGANNVS